MITQATTVVLVIDIDNEVNGRPELIAVQFADTEDAETWLIKNPQVPVFKTVRLVPRNEALSHFPVT